MKANELRLNNYFDNNGIAKLQYTSSIPVVGSGSFGNATGTIKGGANYYNAINSSNTQGLTGGNYLRPIWFTPWAVSSAPIGAMSPGKGE